jgi:hypothetical protein
VRFIAYYHISVGLIFYSLGLLLLYEGARNGVFARLINTDIIIPLSGLVIALFSIVWGLIELKMGIEDLTEGEENGKA